MSTIEESIDINVPVRAAYDQWTQFEEFPAFMEGVDKVTQIDDTHLHWVAEIAGVKRELDSVITEQHPDERVAWTSTSGTSNAGVVTFHKLDDTKTRVMLQLEIKPEGAVERAGDASGDHQAPGKRRPRAVQGPDRAAWTADGGWRGDVSNKN